MVSILFDIHSGIRNFFTSRYVVTVSANDQRNKELRLVYETKTKWFFRSSAEEFASIARAFFPPSKYIVVVRCVSE